MERYQKIEKNGNCGEGTYGVVYKARDKVKDTFVAMKCVQSRGFIRSNSYVEKFVLKSKMKVFLALR